MQPHFSFAYAKISLQTTDFLITSPVLFFKVSYCKSVEWYKWWSRTGKCRQLHLFLQKKTKVLKQQLLHQFCLWFPGYDLEVNMIKSSKRLTLLFICSVMSILQNIILPVYTWKHPIKKKMRCVLYAWSHIWFSNLKYGTDAAGDLTLTRQAPWLYITIKNNQNAFIPVNTNHLVIQTPIPLSHYLNRTE